MYSFRFQSPNMSIVRDCRSMLAYYSNIHLRSLTIGALKSDLTYLWSYFIELDQNTSDALRKASNYLDVTFVSDALHDFKQHAEDSDEYEERLRLVMNDVKCEIYKWTHEIERSLINFSSFSYTGNKYRLRQLRETVSNLRKIADLTAKDSNYENLLTQEKKLNLAIEAYENQNLYNQIEPVAKQIGSTVESGLDANSPANFKKAMIVGGVQVALSVLKVASDIITYEHLCSARDEIRNLIAGVQSNLSDIQLQVGEKYRELSLIEDFENLQAPRSEFVSEVEKLLKAHLAFIDGFVEASGPAQEAAHYIKFAPAFKNYVNDTLRAWRKI
ncbi:hypothetical protein [Pseudomonas sp. UFMG81]|uniref:hypothetical protein n=1 Tax=Pseudomonas sp. UFMG81 TaxID=2745936 RepID=UPI0018907A80|nr:hypothetical protein [Pseudomonas sp. UFMG81]